jgi:hypothetical protein
MKRKPRYISTTTLPHTHKAVVKQNVMEFKWLLFAVVNGCLKTRFVNGGLFIVVRLSKQ